MTYDYNERKIVAVLRDDLEAWQAMNALGHMAIALGANKDGQLMGKAVLTDASGVNHVGLARFGVIIKKALGDELSSLARAVRNDTELMIIDFTHDMLETRHDDELAAAIAHRNESEHRYLGILVYGPKVSVDSYTKAFRLY